MSVSNEGAGSSSERRDSSSRLLELLAEGGQENRKARVSRGIAWSDWEDQALAIQILADDTIVDKTGTKQERWSEVAEHLKAVGINCTWISFKDRIDSLLLFIGYVEIAINTRAIQLLILFL